MSDIKTAYSIIWTEYERGWGSRPEGISYCKTKEIDEKMIRENIARFSTESGRAPDYYINADGPNLVDLSDKPDLYSAVQKEDIVFID